MGIKMKSFVLLALMMITSSAFAIGPNFPSGPNPKLTPGKLCDIPASYRYPEQIAYCERDVTYETKEILIAQYDSQLGYHVQTLPRSDFKIDHFIPLCAGGSNDVSNLWPQHKSVYAITDPIEPLICAKMATGKLSQADAVTLIVRVKTDLRQARDVMKFLSSF
jgi:hypothetical protein